MRRCWARWCWPRLLLGESPPPARQQPAIQGSQYQLVHATEFAVYAVLGVAGGLVSVAFTKLLLGMRERFLRLPTKDTLVSTFGRRVVGRFGGMVCAPGHGRWL